VRIPLTPYRFEPDVVHDPAWASLQVWQDRGGYPAEALVGLPDAVTSRRLGVYSPLLHEALGPGMAVLDLGCGAGLDLHLAARAVGRGGLVAGLDPVADLVDVARAHAPGGCEVDLRVGRAETLPWPDDRFDVVHVNCMLSLLPARAPVLAEAARVLRPAGSLVVCDVVHSGALEPGLQRALAGNGNGVGMAPSRNDLLDDVAALGLVVEARRDVSIDRDALLDTALTRTDGAWTPQQHAIVVDLVDRLADRLAILQLRARA